MPKLSRKCLIADCRAFSLFELMIVLLLMGVLAGIVMPATGKFLDNLQFKKKVAAVSATFRYVRLLSVTKGSEVRVSIDENNNQAFRITGPVDETKELGLGTEDVLTMEPIEAAFLPEGYATPAVVTLTSGKRLQRIVLDPLTGMVVKE